MLCTRRPLRIMQLRILQRTDRNPPIGISGAKTWPLHGNRYINDYQLKEKCLPFRYIKDTMTTVLWKVHSFNSWYKYCIFSLHHEFFFVRTCRIDDLMFHTNIDVQLLTVHYKKNNSSNILIAWYNIHHASTIWIN